MHHQYVCVMFEHLFQVRESILFISSLVSFQVTKQMPQKNFNMEDMKEKKITESGFVFPGDHSLDKLNFPLPKQRTDPFLNEVAVIQLLSKHKS